MTADLADKKVLVTGGNSGIGYQAAWMLAERGAEVILGCRNAQKAQEACTGISLGVGSSTVSWAKLDLSSLDSVKRFAETMAEQHDRIDVLINNAGVMATPYRTTEDGFELQFGTNHLGHFALTARLLPQLLAAPHPRVVNVSSTAHAIGTIRFEDLQSQTSYGRWTAYGQSKLANLLFTKELARRAGDRLLAVACHPGYASTHLQATGSKMRGSTLGVWFWSVVNRLVAQDARMGALPTVFAASSPQVEPADYIGPNGIFEIWGKPKKVKPWITLDPEVAERLWTESEQLTGVDFAL